VQHFVDVNKTLCYIKQKGKPEKRLTLNNMLQDAFYSTQPSLLQVVAAIFFP
jgi:hypothetical protein